MPASFSKDTNQVPWRLIYHVSQASLCVSSLYRPRKLCVMPVYAQWHYPYHLGRCTAELVIVLTDMARLAKKVKTKTFQHNSFQRNSLLQRVSIISTVDNWSAFHWFTIRRGGNELRHSKMI